MSSSLRVENKFKNRQSLGINLEKKSVNFEFIKTQLTLNRICIVLVNAVCLNGNDLENENLIDDDDFSTQNVNSKIATCCYFYSSSYQHNEKSNNFDSNSSQNKKSTNYFGHFIVLIGFDDRKSLVFYRNPASRKPLSCTSYLNFEKARLSYGTDEDILFIYF